MASASAIEWTEQTWNPLAGCAVLTPGCTNCYAMKMAARLDAMGQPLYKGLTKPSKAGPVWRGTIRRASDDVLLAPLRRKKPTTYFVNSMSDLFYETFPDEWIDQVFAVMALTPQHTYQVLTKRAERMRDYVNVVVSDRQRFTKWAANGSDIARAVNREGEVPAHWPLPNVWLGVSTERQKEADERVPLLLQTPAAVRFISAEPLLGPIDLIGIFARFQDTPNNNCAVRLGDHLINWVIVGGESGSRARPMHPDWARGLRDQCAAAGIAFFFKQWGSWYPLIDRDLTDPDWRRDYAISGREPYNFQILNLAGGMGFHGERVHLMQRMSKNEAGRYLDGINHDATPAHGG